MKRIKGLILFVAVFFVGVFSAYAQSQQGAIPTPVTNVDQLNNLLCNFIITFFWILITLSVIYVLISAFHYVTAGDDTEKTSKARRTLTYAAVGIAIALLATQVPNIVGSIFPNLQGSQLNLQCNVL